ncbi:MAG: hypothetical protein J6J18_09500 [Oscillospiraceae bacterium]|nr:hypothetical protein [Oscillospiraceae bacterium]
MKIGNYEIGSYPAIIKKTYADGSFGYETSFSDHSDLYESMKAIHSCIGKTVGIATSDPKVLTGMTVIRGMENIIRELSAKPEQLFRCNTVKQRKIMEWLVAQGITGEDVASAKLIGPAMVRVTNPAGQYMDLYCNDAYEVRILDVTAEREEELRSCFWDETNEPDSEEWREDLTEDEAAMVEQWDESSSNGFSRLAQDILNRESDCLVAPEQDCEPEL